MINVAACISNLCRNVCMPLHICWFDHHLTPAAANVHSCMQDLNVVPSAVASLLTVQGTNMRLLQKATIRALMADGDSPQLPCSAVNAQPNSSQPSYPLTCSCSEDLRAELLSGCSSTTVQGLTGSAALANTSQVCKTNERLTSVCRQLLCGCHAKMSPKSC